MARDMYLVGVDEEELKPDPKPEGPKTPKGKWENYWYHYKWHTIGALFIVVVLAITIGQMVNRDDPDYTIMLVTENGVPEGAVQRFAAELEAVGRDLDGDGKVEVQVMPITMGQGQLAAASAQQMVVHIAAADVLFFAFEPAYYEQYVTKNTTEEYQFLAKIGVEDTGIFDDGRAWNWKNYTRRTQDALLSEYMPEDLYFGVRDAVGAADKKDAVKMRDECLELLRAFITDTPLPKETPVSSAAE